MKPLIQIGDVIFAVVYDNVVAGGPASQLELAWAELRMRLSELNAIVKEEFTARDGTSLATLGLEWRPSLSGLRWRLLDKFVDKARKLALSLVGEVPVKAIASAIGTVAWSRYAALRDLFDLQPAYRLLSNAVSARGRAASMDASPFEGVRDALLALPGLGWRSATALKTEVLVFSDAHVSGFGVVGGDPLAADQGTWPKLFASADMFYLEAIAAKKAVQFFRGPGRHLYLATDNKALMFALKKGSTACPRTAVVLAELNRMLSEAGSRVTPGWIPTDFNPADSLSRGMPLDPVKI